MRLKESTQPRYTLELGLVKMTEMRRLSDLEELLNRLTGASIATSANFSPSAMTATGASLETSPPPDQEKKTLTAEPSAITHADDTAEDPEIPVYAFDQEPSDLLEPPKFNNYNDIEPPLPTSYFDDKSFSGLVTKLEPLTSIELEHVADEKLDDAYEMALLRAGDDLSPIPGAPSLVDRLLGRASGTSVSAGTAAAAIAPARDISRFTPPIIEEDNEPVEQIVLSADPTEEELRAYARSLPSVRRLIRLFKAEIVEIKRTR
jgi:hypothetical protein